MSKLTADTITTAQIKTLRTEAKRAGDVIMADICDVALSGKNSNGHGTTLGKPLTFAKAISECVKAINNGRG